MWSHQENVRIFCAITSDMEPELAFRSLALLQLYAYVYPLEYCYLAS